MRMNGSQWNKRCSVTVMISPSVLVIVVFSTVSFSQEPSDRHPGGFGQPGEQPVCEVQQCGTEDHPQLENVGSQRIQKGLDAHDF